MVERGPAGTGSVTLGVGSQEQWSDKMRAGGAKLRWVGAVFFSLVSTTYAQTAWDVLEDGQSESICGVVNAVNSATGEPIQLVILTDTSQLMIVTRTDTILADTFVDGNNNVTDLDQPRGFVEFATDGDGFRTVWWVALDGTVVEVDPFDGAVSAGVGIPDDFINVPCDACEFVDFPPDDVCFIDGDPVIPPIVINLCGMGTTAMVPMSLLGLGGMALIRRRL